MAFENKNRIRRGIEAVITRRSWKTIVLITANSPKPLILLGFSHFFLHFARWASRSFLAIFLISYFGICWPFGQFDTRRVIEAVITRWSWKPFAGNGAWVRISHPPPNKVVDFDRKSTTFFLCQNALISRDFEPSPYKATRPGVFSRTGFSCLRLLLEYCNSWA